MKQGLTLKGELAAHWPGWADTQHRRDAATRKLRIYGEEYLGMLRDSIEERMGPGRVTFDVKRFATRSPNLLKSVVDSVAVAYQRGCARELRGLGDSASKAFAAVVTESGIDRKQSGINARSWLQGPVLCVPHIDSRNRLALDLADADAFDVVREGDYIEQALWYEQGEWIELTADAWNYYDQAGDLVRSVTHSAGVCPAVAFTSMDNTRDYWSSSEHAGLVDTTLLVGYKAAFGLYVRQSAAVPLTTIFADIEKIAEGQVLGHPIQPVLLPADAKIQVDDRIVPAKDYLDEISAIITMAISAEGIPPGSVQMVTGQGEWGTLAVAVEGSRLAVLRDRQVPHLRAHELELWPLCCAVLRNSTHRLARELPPPDEVRDALRVTFPDLATPKDTIDRIAALEAGLPHGLTSATDFMLAARPEMDRAAVQEQIAANLVEYAVRNELLASRNTPADASKSGETLAQKQGREGGELSAKSRADSTAAV